MDITQGLPENLEIEWRGRRRIQSLDYLGVLLDAAFVEALHIYVVTVTVTSSTLRSPSQII
jgi:hypothetical protein